MSAHASVTLSADTVADLKTTSGNKTHPIHVLFGADGIAGSVFLTNEAADELVDQLIDAREAVTAGAYPYPF